MAAIDLTWFTGVKEALSQPITLLVDESEDARITVNQHRFVYIVDADSFKNM